MLEALKTANKTVGMKQSLKAVESWRQNRYLSQKMRMNML